MGEVAALPPDEVWREMRLHLDWNPKLALVFLFSDSAAALQPLRRYTSDAWQWKTAPLKFIAPTKVEGALDEVVQGMQEQVQRLPDTRAPVWIELLATATATAPWDQVRGEVLARFNEGREWLSKSFARPLIIALPSAWLEVMSFRAPDLWHVRSFVASVAPPVEEPPIAASRAKDELKALAEPQGLPATVNAQLAPLRQAVAAARERAVAKPSPGTKRDVSIALNDLVDAMLECGLAPSAVAHAEESLALIRQLARELGESPQVLRDLSVSLDKVGDAQSEAGRGQEALAAYEEALLISRQLREALGESPQVLRDVFVSLLKVGDAQRQEGRVQEALAGYEEGLVISRRLREALGESPQVLRDVSIALERMGDAQREAGRRQEALATYEEGLVISRRLREALGESPQVLDDLAVSLERLARYGELLRHQRLAHAQEAVQLRQRLAASTDGPRYAQRLAVAQSILAELGAQAAAQTAKPI